MGIVQDIENKVGALNGDEKQKEIVRGSCACAGAYQERRIEAGLPDRLQTGKCSVCFDRRPIILGKTDIFT